MSAQSSGRMVNLGCGDTWHSDWLNIDQVAEDPHVQYTDLRRGIPLADESCDVVYHAHLLEHFSWNQGKRFMGECWRILKPGGIIRVVVPDLEYLARQYLDALEQAKNGTEADKEIHEWTVIALYDQAVRTQNWGRAKCFLRNVKNKQVREYIVANHGETQAVFREADRHLREWGNVDDSLIKEKMTWAEEITRLIIGPKYYQALQEIRFRAKGEVHKWMYDQVSLANLLNQLDFKNVATRTAYESYVPNWTRYQLDTNEEDIERKPESLYMEAIR